MGTWIGARAVIPRAWSSLRLLSGFQTHPVREYSAQTSPSENDSLYPGHIPTSSFQKMLLTGSSAVIAITNPARDDMICAMGEASGHYALKYMKEKMENDDMGRMILQNKPIISKETVDLDYLGSLHAGSFGKAYWRFLKNHGFDPDARRPVNFVDDKELAYVMLRYRQIHDLTHTLLGMKPNILGEVAVKWFEAIQTRLPMCVAAAIAGPIRLGPKQGKLWREQLLTWSVQNGLQAKLLMNVYFENYWEEPLDKLRNELNIAPPPCNRLN